MNLTNFYPILKAGTDSFPSGRMVEVLCVCKKNGEEFLGLGEFTWQLKVENMEKYMCFYFWGLI